MKGLNTTDGNAVGPPESPAKALRPGPKPGGQPLHAPGFIPATKFKLQRFSRKVKAAVRKVLKKARVHCTTLCDACLDLGEALPVSNSESTNTYSTVSVFVCTIPISSLRNLKL